MESADGEVGCSPPFFAERLVVGKCRSCGTLIAGYQIQNHDHNKILKNEPDVGGKWSDVIRVYPQPARMPSSFRIPKMVTASLMEADNALQGSAPHAACVMLGRALEAVCRDLLLTPQERLAKKQIMLGEGIKKLREQNIIDARLFDWAEQLQASRNLAAHADGITISLEDAKDLQTFACAMIEYIYDLTELYEEFRHRRETSRGRRLILRS